jgi:hypothetical protein
VREVQTLSMPVTMIQLMVFFFASYAMAARAPRGICGHAGALLLALRHAGARGHARGMWPHALARVWQALWVAIFIKGGAALFRKRVMKSGPARRPETAVVFPEGLKPGALRARMGEGVCPNVHPPPDDRRAGRRRRHARHARAAYPVAFTKPNGASG